MSDCPLGLFLRENGNNYVPEPAMIQSTVNILCRACGNEKIVFQIRRIEFAVL